MSDVRCERARELIPDLAAGRLDRPEAVRVEEHVEACPSCAAELELVSLLHDRRPRVPPALAGRIKAELGGVVVPSPGAGPATSRRKPRRPGPGFLGWGLAAAAVAAVSLGVGLQLRSPDPGGSAAEVPAFAVEAEDDELWVSDDGEIAGAPTLEDLTDEALLRFLEELDAGGVA